MFSCNDYSWVVEVPPSLVNREVIRLRYELINYIAMQGYLLTVLAPNCSLLHPVMQNSWYCERRVAQ